MGGDIWFVGAFAFWGEFVRSDWGGVRVGGYGLGVGGRGWGLWGGGYGANGGNCE